MPSGWRTPCDLIPFRTPCRKHRVRRRLATGKAQSLPQLRVEIADLRRDANLNLRSLLDPTTSLALLRVPERLLPSGHARLYGSAIDRSSAQIHRRDLSRVRDVVERIGIEHDEVGALAWRDCAE